MTIVTLELDQADLKTVESCLREHFAEARYGNIKIRKIEAELSTREEFENISVYIDGPGSNYCFNKGNYHDGSLVYFEISRQKQMIFVQKCTSNYVYTAQGRVRHCKTFNSCQDIQKCGQLTKKASNLLWNANYSPYISTNPLLRSVKIVLYELRNKVNLQFHPADFHRIQDFIRENFDESRYKNITVKSIEGIRSLKTNVINPIIVRIDGPAYCYNFGGCHEGVYFEITIGTPSTGLESQELSWFQQRCYNTASARRNTQTIHCELFKSASINKTGKLSKNIVKILRNPVATIANSSDEYQDPVHGIRWSKTNGKRLCSGKENTCKKLAKGEKHLCVGCGGGYRCKSQGCDNSSQYDHDGLYRKHYKQVNVKPR